MGRKRLLTLLTAVSMTAALQAAPAAAQVSVGGIEVDVEETLTGSDDDDCLRVGVDVTLSEALKLDPSVCVLDGDGTTLEAEGKVEAGDQEVDVGETTKPATDTVDRTVNRTVERTTEAAGGSGSTGGSDGGSSGGSNGASESGSTSSSNANGTTSRSSTSGGGSSEDVVIAGGAADFAAAQPRTAQADLLAQLRDGLAAQRRADVAFGPVAPGVGFPGIAAAPEVADRLAAGIEAPQAAGSAAPEVIAPTPERQNAILASGPASSSTSDVPAALQLLTGAMVLGAGTVWYLARREYGVAGPSAG